MATKTDLLVVKADPKSDIARLEANMAAMESRLVKGEVLAGCKAEVAGVVLNILGSE